MYLLYFKTMHEETRKVFSKLFLKLTSILSNNDTKNYTLQKTKDFIHVCTVTNIQQLHQYQIAKEESLIQGS